MGGYFDLHLTFRFSAVLNLMCVCDGVCVWRLIQFLHAWVFCCATPKVSSCLDRALSLYLCACVYMCVCQLINYVIVDDWDFEHLDTVYNSIPLWWFHLDGSKIRGWTCTLLSVLPGIALQQSWLCKYFSYIWLIQLVHAGQPFVFAEEYEKCVCMCVWMTCRDTRQCCGKVNPDSNSPVEPAHQ